MEEEEIARLNVVLSFTMSSLFYMFLKTQGASTASHPVKKELARIQEYIKKLKTASDRHRQTKSNEAAAAKLLDEVAKEDEAHNPDEEDNNDGPQSTEKKSKKGKKDKKHKDKKSSRKESKESGSEKKKRKAM